MAHPRHVSTPIDGGAAVASIQRKSCVRLRIESRHNLPHRLSNLQHRRNPLPPAFVVGATAVGLAVVGAGGGPAEDVAGWGKLGGIEGRREAVETGDELEVEVHAAGCGPAAKAAEEIGSHHEAGMETPRGVFDLRGGDDRDDLGGLAPGPLMEAGKADGEMVRKVDVIVLPDGNRVVPGGHGQEGVVLGR